MRKSSIYKISLIIMFLVNATLIFLLVTREDKPFGSGKKGESLMIKISNELVLDEQQEANYFKLAKGHRKTIKELELEQRKLIKSYFNFLKEQDATTEKMAPILEQLKAFEVKKLTITYQHFEELKALCNPEQQDRFEFILDEVLQVLIKNKRGEHSTSVKKNECNT